MTDAEWLACTEPDPMLAFLYDKASKRKLRLFTVACCRRIWPLLPNASARRAVEVGERYADKQAKEAERKSAEEAVRAAARPYSSALGALFRKLMASAAAELTLSRRRKVAEHASSFASSAVGNGPTWAKDAENEAQTLVLRDIIGNPFRPISLDRGGLSSTVVGLAEAAYDGRALPGGELDAVRLAVLADALEEAGASGELVDHLRGPGPHVRGCWALDLVLGKQ